jgi:hypothetical protein
MTRSFATVGLASVVAVTTKVNGAPCSVAVAVATCWLATSGIDWVLGPPDSTMAGMSTVAAAMIWAGVVLSQPVVSTTASSG